MGVAPMSMGGFAGGGGFSGGGMMSGGGEFDIQPQSGPSGRPNTDEAPF